MSKRERSHGRSGLRTASWAALAVLAGATASFAQQELLGTDGTVYSLRLGTERELFRVGTGLGDRLLLALDVERDGRLERLLLPGTQEALEALLPRLGYLRESDSTFALWESQVNTLHSQLNLVRFDHEAGFSNVVEISGRPFVRRLQTVVQPIVDSVASLLEDAPAQQRALVHVAWLDSEGGTWYLPVVDQPSSASLALGSPVALHRLLDLPEGGRADRFTVDARLAPDGRSLIVARLDRELNEVRRFAVFPVPSHVSEMATVLEQEIASGDPSAPLTSHTDQVRATIVDIGRSLGPAIADAIATEVEGRAFAWATPNGSNTLDAFAAEIKDQFIRVAADFERLGLASGTAKDRAARVVSVPMAGLDGPNESTDVVVFPLGSLPFADAPPLAAPPLVRVSNDGQRLALFRLVEGELHYRLFLGTDWGAWVVLRRASSATGLGATQAERLLANLLDS